MVAHQANNALLFIVALLVIVTSSVNTNVAGSAAIGVLRKQHTDATVKLVGNLNSRKLENDDDDDDDDADDDGDSGDGDGDDDGDSGDGLFYIACGNPGGSNCKDENGKSLPVYQAGPQDLHYVRCCSDSPLNGFDQNGGCSVYGASSIDGSCSGTKTQADAAAFCASAGARLCTHSELYNGCTRGTGCMYDKEWIWTAEPYVPPEPIVQSDGHHWLVCGNPDGGNNCKDDQGEHLAAKGSHDMEQHAVRCCSDTELNWNGKVEDKCDNIWGYSEVPNYGTSGAGTCYSASTYAEADRLCTDGGARLCTYDELFDECPRGTGCGFDSEFIWSSKEFVETVIEQSNGTHWLVCGGGSASGDGCTDEDGKAQLTVAASDGEGHEVRCCSDSPLEWKDAVKNQDTCPGVWGASYIPQFDDISQSKCFSSSTYAEAKHLCESNGARLCTQLEIAQDCVQGSGCKFDYEWVWTDTEAVETIIEPTDGFHNLACGNPSSSGCKDNIGRSQTLSRAHDREVHDVRCCSETELPFFKKAGAVKNSGCGVYAFSEAPELPGSTTNIQCMKAYSHWEAEALCSSHGARLCTQTEMVMGCSRNSGCGFDAELVWTSSEACATEEECEKQSHSNRFIGCYRDQGSPHLEFKLGRPYSLDMCFTSCEQAGYPYFGIKNGNTCYCGNNNDEDAFVAASECSKTCMLGEGSCGGSKAISVYRTGLAPNQEYNHEREYRGCVADNNGDMLNTKVSDNASIKSCVETCTDRNFALGGLTNGKECWCGDERPLQKSSDCILTCKHGRGLCGGPDGISLYKTLNDKIPLKSLFECKGGLANLWGDPHLISFDDRKFDCQGIGHFIITECVDYVLQGIFKAATNSRRASVTHGAVAQYRDFPKVQVMISDEPGPYTVHMSDGCPVDLYIDGTLYNTTLLEDSPIDITMTRNAFEIQFPEGGPAIRTKIRNGRGCLLDIDTCVHEECLDSTVGLLGSPNGNPQDDWMFRDGRLYDGGSNAFEYCTGVWCLQEASESLFSYPPGMSFADYDECSGNPVDPGPIDTSNVPAEAADICAGLEGGAEMEEACLIDIAEATDVPRALEEIQENMFDVVIDEEFDDAPPPTPVCPEDVVMVEKVGSTDFAYMPVKVLSFDTSTVTVEISSPLPEHTVDEVHVWYPLKTAGIGQCEGYAAVEGSFTQTLTLKCYETMPMAMIHLYAADEIHYSAEAGDDASIPNCCEAADGLPAVEYTFQISCVPQCPTEVYETA